MAKEKQSTSEKPIRVKSLKTVYYDDGLRMPGTVFDIKCERHFSKKAMKRVETETRLSRTPVSDSLNNKRLPPGPERSEAEQLLEEERLEAESEASDDSEKGNVI